MEDSRPVKVSPPPLSSPVVDSAGMPTKPLIEFLYKLWLRTGGNKDKPDQALKGAGAAQESANEADQKAAGAQESADIAYQAANDGQAPIGGVMPIAGGFAVPENWAVCDGDNGTPDLRGMFVIAASAEYPAGSTGGAKESTASTEESLASDTGSGIESLTLTAAGAATGVDIDAVTGVTADGHDHTVPPHTHEVTIATIPPYYSMVWIMRLS